MGTGNPTTVLEIVRAFEEAAGITVPYEIVARRPGDVAASYADVDKAHTELGWRAEKSVADASADTYRWQSDNPNGFAGA